MRLALLLPIFLLTLVTGPALAQAPILSAE